MPRQASPFRRKPGGRHFLAVLLCAMPAMVAWAVQPFETILTEPPSNGEDSVLYRTANGFTSDEKYFVFGRRHEPRSAAKGLGSRHHYYRRDLATGEEVDIAYDPRMGFLNGVVSGNSLFYATAGADATIYSVDIRSGEKREVWKLPPNERYGKWKLGDISAELGGTRVAVAFSDEVPVKRGDKLNDWLNQYLASDAHSYLYVGDLKDGEWTFAKAYEILDVSQGWFNHVQLNPLTGQDVLVDMEGRCVNGIFDRASVIDLRSGERIPVRKGDARACLSHTTYVADGKVQYLIYEKDATLVGLADVRQGTWQEWRAGKHMHYAAFLAADGTFYAVGDRPTKGDAQVVRYTIRGGQLVARDVLGTQGGNTAWEEYHGHPRFSPSGKYLVYTSSQRMEQGQVVIVKDPLKAE